MNVLLYTLITRRYCSIMNNHTNLILNSVILLYSFLKNDMLCGRFNSSYYEIIITQTHTNTHSKHTHLHTQNHKNLYCYQCQFNTKYAFAERMLSKQHILCVACQIGSFCLLWIITDLNIYWSINLCPDCYSSHYG